MITTVFHFKRFFDQSNVRCVEYEVPFRKVYKISFCLNWFKIKIINNCNNLPNSQETVIHTSKANVSEKNKKIKNEPENFTNKHPGAVNSPMVGTAYSSPEPGKETFVKLNSLVSKGDTLLIIEAMKVMNSITAHKSGKVVFIGFEDSQPIEFDQLLVVIE